MNTVVSLIGIFIVLLAALAGAGAYLLTGNITLGVVPVVILGVLLLLPKLTYLKKPENILYLYVGLVFFVDDSAGRAWLNQNTITEQLSIIFFKTFVFNGNEVVSFALAGWIILRTRLTTWKGWIKSGLLTLLFTSSILMLVHFFYIIYGMGTGGNFKDAFVQSRFNHLLPIWCFVGWGLVKNLEIANKILTIFALLWIFKGYQGVFNFYYHLDYFSLQEYLITHFASGFIVVATVYILTYSVFFTKNMLFRVFLWFNTIPLFLSFVYNDRRSAIIAIILAMVCCVSSLPLLSLKKFGKPLLKASVLIGIYMGATWNMSGPIAALSAPLKSIIQGQPNEGPSSREIENFNLFSSIIRYPYMGLGLGKEYVEIWQLPKIDHIYARNNMLPHNGLLFFWVFSGPIGIGAVGCFFTFAYFILAHFFRDPRNKPAVAFGIAGMFFVTQYIVFIFADQSYHNNRAMFLTSMFVGGGARILSEQKLFKEKERAKSLQENQS